jgi:L-seryl-tRNA(Ser) seleniumtransferase
MRLPSVLKDLLPSESVKQWMDLVTQPKLAAGLREAAEQLGWKEMWSHPQLQHSVLEAKKWLDTFQERWREGQPAALKLGINATGRLFSSQWSMLPLPPSAISIQAYVSSGFTVPAPLGRENQQTLQRMGHAESALVTQSLEQAIWLLGRGLGANEKWALPRADCIRLARGADIESLLAAGPSGILEVGASNVCSLRDVREAIAQSAGGLIQVHPSRMASAWTPDDQAALVAQKLPSGASLKVVDILLNGSLIDLSPLGIPIPVVGERLRQGVTAVALPGDGWLGGPACGILLGSEDFLAPLRDLGERMGCLAATATVATLQATLIASSDWEAWRMTPIGQITSNSRENLLHRSQRLAVQLRGLPAISQVEHGQASFPLADSPLESLALESGFVRLHFNGMSAAEAHDRLAHAELPLWSLVDPQGLTLVLRTTDPADDMEIVRAMESLRP